MIRRCALMLFALVALAPADAEAQRRRPVQIHIERDRGNPFTFEPYAGFYRDAYDIGNDDDRTTYTLGMQLGHRLGSRGRLLGTIGYAKSDDVADNQGGSYNVFDNTWILTTAGAEYAVVPGNTNISVGAQAGVGWRKNTFEGTVGDVPLPEQGQSDDGYASYDVVVPHVTVRYWVTRRAALTLRLQDYMFDVLEGPVDHSPAATLGVTIR